MKKHNIVKVVLITILVFLLLSWIFPAAYYSGKYIDQGRVQMGLSELFNYPMTTVSYFGHYAIFIILVGGFYGILYKIPAYRTFLDKVASKFEGKEKVFLAIISVLFAFGVSIAGLQVGFIFFVPFVVSLILLLGYDKIVAAMVVVGSMAVGLLGSTYSVTNLNLLTNLLSLKIDYQIGVRFVILLVGLVLLLFNLFMYIKNTMGTIKVNKKEEKKSEPVIEKVEEEKDTKPKTTTKKTTTSSKNSKSTGGSKNSKNTKSTKSNKSHKNVNKAALRDEDIIVVKESVVNDSEKDSYLVPSRVEITHKIWPFVVLFSLMFILFVMAFINWGEGGFGVTLFDDITKSVTEFELFGFPIFAKVYGSVNSFGNWSIIDMFLPMALVILILSIIYKIKIDELFDGFIQGAKKALAPAVISILVYTVLVVVTYHPFQMSLYKAILGISKGFNIITTMIVMILSSLFNVDPTYVFQAVLPYYTSVVTNADNYANVGIIAQTMYGFTTLFAPTSFILMTALSYLGVSYSKWLKNIWKLLLELFVILLIIFIILSLI